MQGVKDNDPSPGSAPGPAKTEPNRLSGRGRQQLDSPMISAMAAFLKCPQGTKSVWLLASEQCERAGADPGDNATKGAARTSGRGMACVCVRARVCGHGSPSE